MDFDVKQMLKGLTNEKRQLKQKNLEAKSMTM